MVPGAEGRKAILPSIGGGLPTGPRRSSTTLARVRARSVIVSERDEVETQRVKLVEQIQRSYEEAAVKSRGGSRSGALVAD